MARTLAAPQPSAAQRSIAADGPPPSAAPAAPSGLDRADLPLPIEDVRGSLRMFVLAGLSGLGFWIGVGILVL